MSVALALALGVALGFVAQRGAFCMNSGLRSAAGGDWTKVKALLLAVSVQLVALPLVFHLGWARPAVLPLMPVAALLGGLLFGASMRWAGGCAAGVCYKLGAGDLGGLLAAMGLVLGALAAEAGMLAALRASLQQHSVPVAATGAGVVPLLVGLASLVALWRTADGRMGAWGWRRTGLLVGAIAAVTWPLAALAGRSFGLAVLPGATGLASAAIGRPFSSWDAALVAGIVAGGWAAARSRGPVALSAPPPPQQLRRFLGGLGLGVGGALAGGCTVGHALAGLGILSPASVLVTLAIFAGSALAELAARHAPVAAPAAAA